LDFEFLEFDALDFEGFKVGCRFRFGFVFTFSSSSSRADTSSELITSCSLASTDGRLITIYFFSAVSAFIGSLLAGPFNTPLRLINPSVASLSGVLKGPASKEPMKADTALEEIHSN
jgi:hypothetical protein